VARTRRKMAASVTATTKMMVKKEAKTFFMELFHGTIS
jgi:hypothetical protein